MWSRRKFNHHRRIKFFSIALSHETVRNTIITNFTLWYDYNKTLEELGEMVPYERDIFISLLNKRQKDDVDQQASIHPGDPRDTGSWSGR